MKLDGKPINSTTTLNDLSPILFESKENFLQKVRMLTRLVKNFLLIQTTWRIRIEIDVAEMANVEPSPPLLGAESEQKTGGRTVGIISHLWDRKWESASLSQKGQRCKGTSVVALSRNY